VNPETTAVALLGFGYWGANLARNLASSPSITFVGIADADETQRAEAARRFPGARIWSSIDEVLDDPDVDAVVVATPAHTHAALARRILLAQRHVLVEKPLAMNPEDADEVADVALATGLVAMVGHTFLYSPPVRRLRRYVEEGELGQIQYLYSQRLSLGKIRRDCNALWNFAPHDISIMLYVLQERPVEVSARGFAFIQPGIEDVCFASLSFESGVGGNLHVSWIDPRKTRLMTVVGDQKMAVYNDVSADQKIWLFDAGVARSEDPTLGEYASMGEFQWRTRAGDIVIPTVAMEEPLLLELNAFGESCRTGAAPLASARHGADVVRVLTAIDSSMRAGGAPIRLVW
jgi:predicted dehydrogenase